MATNILSIPFRRTKPVPLAENLKSFISTTLDQHPEQFKDDLVTLDRLRADIITIDIHPSSLERLLRYHGQLLALSSKVPLDVGIAFTWYPSLSPVAHIPITQANLLFERLSVLYNIGALFSQLATSQSRITAESLKRACQYFQQAAGTFEYLSQQTGDLRLPPGMAVEDFSEPTVESLKFLMLAQAQECFWQKGVLDQMKDSLISRLSVQVSEFYDQALSSAMTSVNIPSDWITHITAKKLHFYSAAQYRKSKDAATGTGTNKYGEELARLQEALRNVNKALERKNFLSKGVRDDLLGLQEILQRDTDRAEKDNDLIYLNPVPAFSALPPLQKAPMVKPILSKDVNEPNANITGPQLFRSLTPYAVRQAISLYNERKNTLIGKQMIPEWEAITSQDHTVLRELGLPGSLQAVEVSLGLPPSLVAHMDDVKAKGGIAKLKQMRADVRNLCASDKEIYAQAVESLQAEAREDELLREKHGTQRWTRVTSQEASKPLQEQGDRLGGFLKMAEDSDSMVRSKLLEWEDVITLLSSDKDKVEAFVPSTQRTKLSPESAAASQRVREALNDSSRAEARRRRMIEDLRFRMEADDIHDAIIEEAAAMEPTGPVSPADFEEYFSRRLDTHYAENRNEYRLDQMESGKLRARLREANTAFVKSRKSDTSLEERERALQRLETGYLKFLEIAQNLDEGRKFYNELARMIGRWREEIRGFVYQRKKEARDLEGDLSIDMSKLKLSDTKASTSPAERRTSQRTTRSASRQLKEVNPESDTRSKTTDDQRSPGMWTPDQGIRFG